MTQGLTRTPKPPTWSPEKPQGSCRGTCSCPPPLHSLRGARTPSSRASPALPCHLLCGLRFGHTAKLAYSSLRLRHWPCRFLDLKGLPRPFPPLLRSERRLLFKPRWQSDLASSRKPSSLPPNPTFRLPLPCHGPCRHVLWSPLGLPPSLVSEPLRTQPGFFSTMKHPLSAPGTWETASFETVFCHSPFFVFQNPVFCRLSQLDLSSGPSND